VTERPDPSTLNVHELDRAEEAMRSAPLNVTDDSEPMERRSDRLKKPVCQR
jgi:hypothetical protein